MIIFFYLVTSRPNIQIVYYAMPGSPDARGMRYRYDAVVLVCGILLFIKQRTQPPMNDVLRWVSAPVQDNPLHRNPAAAAL